MSNFEEAREQSVPLFENTSSGEEIPSEGEQMIEQTEGMTEQETETATEQVAQEAVDTAQQATSIAEEADMQSQTLAQENEFLREQLQTMTNTIQQMSQQREQEIIQESVSETEPTFNPVDLSSLAYGDEETQQRAQRELAENIGKYVMQMMDGRMNDMKPFIEEAQKGRAERDRREALTLLESMDETRGISDVAEDLDVMIQKNPHLFSADVPLNEQYAVALAIKKGIESIKNPPREPAPPTTEELMNMYRNNSEFQNAIERERIEAVKKNQQVPVFSPSNGVGNAAPTINEKPKTMADASSATRKMFLGL